MEDKTSPGLGRGGKPRLFQSNWECHWIISVPKVGTSHSSSFIARLLPAWCVTQWATPVCTISRGLGRWVPPPEHCTSSLTVAHTWISLLCVKWILGMNGPPMSSEWSANGASQARTKNSPPLPCLQLTLGGGLVIEWGSSLLPRIFQPRVL